MLKYVVSNMTSDNYIFLTLSSSEILVQQEVRMYDINTIIGSIGGSLGLFIGFSFLQCSKECMNMTKKLFGMAE